jgi:hypothetical protein
VGRREQRRRGLQGALASAVVLACAALAVPVAASTPPPRSLLVDVAKGSVGGLSLGQASSAFVRSLGFPDYSGAIESKQSQEMLWSRSTSTRSAWAVVRLKGTVVEEVRYGGLFRTASGDRQGTSLAAFWRHWMPKRTVHRVVRDGVTVEYNVLIGRVVFAFDRSMKLRAVGLAPAGRGASLCAIPYVCVTSSLG